MKALWLPILFKQPLKSISASQTIKGKRFVEQASGLYFIAPRQTIASIVQRPKWLCLGDPARKALPQQKAAF